MHAFVEGMHSDPHVGDFIAAPLQIIGNQQCRGADTSAIEMLWQISNDLIVQVVGEQVTDVEVFVTLEVL